MRLRARAAGLSIHTMIRQFPRLKRTVALRDDPNPCFLHEGQGSGEAVSGLMSETSDAKMFEDGNMSADTGCIAGRDVLALLRQAGLRPTRQRMTLGSLLFQAGDRHVTAEQLHAEAEDAGEHVSLATVYNTLHQFKRAGLLREIALEGAKAYFDTNISNHSHFLIESDGTLMDIPSDAIRVSGLPQPPKGMRISHIDIVVRLVAEDETGR